MKNIFTVLKIQSMILAFILSGCSDVVMLSPDAILPDGSEYHGDIKDGFFDGDGMLSYPSGASYIGQFTNGVFSGKGEYTQADGSNYQGDFVDGTATGDVVYQSADGETEYRGEMNAWEYHGVGRLVGPESTYVGEFKNGVFDGQGKIDYQEGNSYSGGFKDNVFVGQGIYQDNGTIYQGEFVDGELKGQGTITTADKTIYIGEVESRLAHGEGQKTDADGNIAIGTFNAGYLQGDGRFVGKDGRQYEGEFAYDKFNGQGKLTLTDQSVYIGEFSYGRYHGDGELRMPSYDEGAPERKKGRWRNGKLVYNSDTGEHLALQAEIALEQHQSLLNTAIAKLEHGRGGQVNAYFLGVAGDGTQSVFRREIEFVNERLNHRYGTQHRSIKLINHHDSADQYPLATTRSFATAVRGIAEHMDKENDVLFLYLSSHGSKDHALSLDHDSINFPSMTANTVGETLRNSGIKWKVVFVSACYAGGFISELDDGNTLIMTAADSENTSFGCSEDSEMTYFGKALFKEVLANDDHLGLEDAFSKAANIIAEWESEQELTASNPQMRKSHAVLKQIKAIRDLSITQRANKNALNAPTFR